MRGWLRRVNVRPPERPLLADLEAGQLDLLRHGFRRVLPDVRDGCKLTNAQDLVIQRRHLTQETTSGYQGAPPFTTTGAPME